MNGALKDFLKDIGEFVAVYGSLAWVAGTVWSGYYVFSYLFEGEEPNTFTVWFFIVGFTSLVVTCLWGLYFGPRYKKKKNALNIYVYYVKAYAQWYTEVKNKPEEEWYNYFKDGYVYRWSTGSNTFFIANKFYEGLTTIEDKEPNERLWFFHTYLIKHPDKKKSRELIALLLNHMLEDFYCMYYGDEQELSPIDFICKVFNVPKEDLIRTVHPKESKG